MSAREIEHTGATVDDAVEKVLRVLGLPRGAVDVEVLDEGSRGILGLGARAAKVLVRVREGVTLPAAPSGTPSPDVAPGPASAVSGVPPVPAAHEDPVEVTREIVAALLERMACRASVHVQRGPEAVQVAIRGDNLGALIGRRGQTLDALEFLVGLMVARRTAGRGRVVVDVGGYRERRHRALEDVARRAAERAVQEGREISLEPMDARERRIIHVTLKSHPRVYTFSQGEGLLRYVVVAPRREGVEPPASEAVDDRNPGAADQVA